jgi:hypothetical protein
MQLHTASHKLTMAIMVCGSHRTAGSSAAEMKSRIATAASVTRTSRMLTAVRVIVSAEARAQCRTDEGALLQMEVAQMQEQSTSKRFRIYQGPCEGTL